MRCGFPCRCCVGAGQGMRVAALLAGVYATLLVHLHATASRYALIRVRMDSLWGTRWLCGHFVALGVGSNPRFSEGFISEGLLYAESLRCPNTPVCPHAHSLGGFENTNTYNRHLSPFIIKIVFRWEAHWFLINLSNWVIIGFPLLIEYLRRFI